MSTAALEALRQNTEEKPFGVVATKLDHFLQMNLPPRKNLLDPWLPKGGICMVYAKRGVGKTFFALEVAMAVACGSQFLSFKASKPKKVLYIDGEMPANVMQERLASIVKRTPLNDIIQYPCIITPDLQHDFMPDLSTLSGQEAIRQYTDNSDLIIVDNISTLGGRGENESETWIPFQQWALGLRRQGKSVLFIHHAGKSGAQRGTSKREDILDTVIVLKHPSDYELTSGACFEIHFEKARSMYGESVNPLYCWLTDGNWKYKPVEESNYLKVIEFYTQGIKQSEIAEALELSKGQVSKLVAKAKKAGALKING